MLYIARNNTQFVQLNYRNFTGGDILPEEKVVALWGGALVSQSIFLPQGGFRITITARGDAAAGEYPHLIVYVNDRQAGNYYLLNEMQQHSLTFDNSASQNVTVKLEMDNDYYEPGKGDRNAFVSQVLFEREDQ